MPPAAIGNFKGCFAGDFDARTPEDSERVLSWQFERRAEKEIISVGKD